MDSEEEFNDFVLYELIDSSSLDDEDNFYFDAANTLDIALWIMKFFHDTTYFIKIIQYLDWNF
jgi:hypothetical protein